MTIDMEHLAVGVVVRTTADTIRFAYGDTPSETEGPQI
jgi:hypothetical protein